MGGSGSGRRAGYGSTLSDCLRLDVRAVARAGRLRPWESCKWTWSRGEERVATIGITALPGEVILEYRTRRGEGPWQDVSERIPMVSTPCQYGGSRTWWSCPGCARRCAVLWIRAGAFRCRTCTGLPYQTQREAAHDRALYRAQRIRLRMGGSASTLEPFPPRPKGMHWDTWWRLREEDQRAVMGWFHASPFFRGTGEEEVPEP